jgi:hypothetical protein
VTPIARLTGEYEVIVVPAASRHPDAGRTGREAEGRSGLVSWAGGSAGGTDHITAGLFAKAVGVDPTKINYVAFSGGGEALAAVLGNQVTVGISGYGEFQAAGRGRRVARDRRFGARAHRGSSMRRPSRKAALTCRAELAHGRGRPGPQAEQKAAITADIEKMAKRLASWKADARRPRAGPTPTRRRRFQDAQLAKKDRSDHRDPQGYRPGANERAGCRDRSNRKRRPDRAALIIAAGLLGLGAIVDRMGPPRSRWRGLCPHRAADHSLCHRRLPDWRARRLDGSRGLRGDFPSASRRRPSRSCGSSAGSWLQLVLLIRFGLFDRHRVLFACTARGFGKRRCG